MPTFLERAIKLVAPEDRPEDIFHVRPVELTSRVYVDVLTTSGSNCRIEFRVRLDTVELWHRDRLSAAFDRELLGEWLHEPDEDLVVDEARLSIDWKVDITGRVALTLPDVDRWTLSPTDLDALYRRVVIDSAEAGR